jgi:hypothetical protein
VYIESKGHLHPCFHYLEIGIILLLFVVIIILQDLSGTILPSRSGSLHCYYHLSEQIESAVARIEIKGHLYLSLRPQYYLGILLYKYRESLLPSRY